MRERVHAVLPDAEETVKMEHAAYTLGGRIVLITAAFKAHAALNFWRGQELRGSNANADAMGQFGRIKSVDELPPDAELDRLIGDAAELAKSAPAPRKTKHAPKPAPVMHPEFAAALDRAPKAKAALDGFPPSAQRDYFEWIAEAKQDGRARNALRLRSNGSTKGSGGTWKYEPLLNAS